MEIKDHNKEVRNWWVPLFSIQSINIGSVVHSLAWYLQNPSYICSNTSSWVDSPFVPKESWNYGWEGICKAQHATLISLQETPKIVAMLQNDCRGHHCRKLVWIWRVRIVTLEDLATLHEQIQAILNTMLCSVASKILASDWHNCQNEDRRVAPGF